MQLTKLAQSLKEAINNDQELTPEQEELFTCMGSECFCYSLFDGGYLKPENFIQGEDLKRVQDAVKVLSEFKMTVQTLHEEI